MIIFKEGFELNQKEKDQIFNIVELCDKDFTPPLSSRNSTTQKELIDTKDKGSVKDYFEGLLSQSFLLCLEEDKIVGFLSFKKDYLIDDNPYDYVSTIIVLPEKRNYGYALDLYNNLFTFRDGYKFATRTWSLNHKHIGILNKMGFNLYRTILNDRGEGIDTVYFVKTN